MSRLSYSIAFASALLLAGGCSATHREPGDSDGSVPNNGDHAGGTPSGPGGSGPNKGGPIGADRNPDSPASCAGTPPTLILSTAAGDQRGEQGSFCISNDAVGCGICGDAAAPETPKKFSIVHSGEKVTLRVLDATLTQPDNIVCEPACHPRMRIAPLSCGQSEARILQDGEVWQFVIPPGTYQIFVDASFVNDDETYGQTEVMFGLIVDDRREPAIVDGSNEPSASCDDAARAATSSCEDRSGYARTLIDDALDSSSLDCVTDADCLVVSTSASCSPGCDHLVNRMSSDAIASAITRAETICGPPGQCPMNPFDCPPPPRNGLASCEAGRCLSMPPQ